MRSYSIGPGKFPAAIERRKTKENREAQLRTVAMRRPHDAVTLDADGRQPLWLPSGYRCHLYGESIMQWQTPQATDMRYGFEITMYIATR
jgi:coenzyme PQQ precursor peptide PqqA